MALLFMDGFEGNDGATKWNTNYSGSSTATVRFPFTGSRAVFGSPRKAIPATAQCTVGFAFNPVNAGGNGTIMSFSSASGAEFNLAYNSTTGLLYLTTSGTLATGTTPLPANGWTYIEVQGTLAAGTGTIKVRLNGSATNEINFTGTTNFSGGTLVTSISWNLSSWWMDDVYIADGTGSRNNGFLGDVRVYPLVPAGAGANTGLTPSAGSNWSNIGGDPVQTANYNYSTTSGAKDSYALSSLPSPAAGSYSVLGVQANASMAKSDAGAAGGENLLWVASTGYPSSAHALGTSFATYSDMYESNPNTAAQWTLADIAALQAGMQVQ